MKRALVLLWLLVGIAVSSSACSQIKLGDVLDKGGKLMPAGDARALLSGAKVSGTTSGGAQFDSRYVPNGEIEGSISGPRGMSMLSGTWKINDRGQVCADALVVSGRGQRIGGCYFYFRLGDEYYVSESSDERSADALKRTVSK